MRPSSFYLLIYSYKYQRPARIHNQHRHQAGLRAAAGWQRASRFICGTGARAARYPLVQLSGGEAAQRTPLATHGELGLWGPLSGSS